MATSEKKKKSVTVKKSVKKPLARKPLAKKKTPVKAKKSKTVAKAPQAKAPRRYRLEDVRTTLMAERQRVRRRLGFIMDGDEANEDFNVGDIADAAMHLESRELRRGLVATDTDLLSQIDAALERVEKGTFGLCVACGNAIEPARLEALLYAPKCIVCKSKEERNPAGR